jgi:ferritin-like metal-binding protein YciE
MARATSPTRARTARKSTAAQTSMQPGKVKMIHLLEHHLKDIYWAEKKTMTSIPKLLRQVESEELTEAIRKCKEVTTKHIHTLASVFRMLDIKLKAKKCFGMEGLWQETDSMISTFDQPMLDPAILECMKKIVRYKVTAYSCMSALAKSLDELRPAKVMKDMLDDETDLLNILEDTTDLHIKRAYLWQVDFD